MLPELNVNRYILDPHLRLSLQHDLQAPIPRLPGLHHLSYAERLQANA